MGGMGGMGGMYSGMGGMGGMGMGGMGMYGRGGPFDPQQSLASRMEQSTAATFQVLGDIVMAFGGFAQMLESTFHATQSSFMAMVGVAEHFGNLKSYFGTIFSIAALFRLARGILNSIRRLLGITVPIDLDVTEFAAFKSPALINGPDGAQVLAKKSPSRKPFLVFLLLSFGLPYLFNKLIQKMRAMQPLQQPLQDQNNLTLDQIAQLPFAKALHTFQPPAAAPENGDLTFTKDDLIAILNSTAPDGSESDWWRGRTEDGRIGWFPKTWVEVLHKKGLPAPLNPKDATIATSVNGSAIQRSLVTSNLSHANSTPPATIGTAEANTKVSSPRIK